MNKLSVALGQRGVKLPVPWLNKCTIMRSMVCCQKIYTPYWYGKVFEGDHRPPEGFPGREVAGIMVVFAFYDVFASVAADPLKVVR